jgi:hypothetical protein
MQGEDIKKQRQLVSPACANPSQTLQLAVASMLVFAVVIVPGAQSASAQTYTVLNSLAKKDHKVGLGKVLSSPYGGSIYGFDINQNGTDGIITEALSLSNGGLKSAVETFDLKTGKITKIVKTLVSPTGGDELFADGIAGNDVALIDEQRATIKNGHVSRDDLFFVMNPVSGGKITGSWTPPNPKNLVFWQLAPNQTTDIQVAGVFRDAFSSDVPWLYVSDIATNTFLNFIRVKSIGNSTLAQDTTTNEAVTVIGTDRGGKAYAGKVVLVNLTTGKTREFKQFNNGFYSAGANNGLAVDSNTGIACTTTNLNSQVAFYTLSNGTGVWAQLPNTTNIDEYNSGYVVANDPLHRFFLVTQPYTSTGSSGSSIDVYDETGNLVETINGFNFENANYPPNVLKIVVNPSRRIGWVNGPNGNQLQQFFY